MSNLPTFLWNTAASAQFPNADLTGGMNYGGSNSPGVGINTGDYGPKPTDWSEDERDTQDGQNLGQTASPITAVQGVVIDHQVAFVQTTGAVAPGGALKPGVINQTGKTVPANTWCWGTKNPS